MALNLDLRREAGQRVLDSQVRSFEWHSLPRRRRHGLTMITRRQ